MITPLDDIRNPILMNYNVRLYSLILLMFTVSLSSHAYQVDNETKEDYKVLRRAYYKHRSDSVQLAKEILKEYIKKARQNNDSLVLADGYYLYSKISDYDLAQQYNDSVIALSKPLNNARYPLLAYQDKATIYYNTFNFKKAFDYYLKVTEEAKKHNKEFYYHQALVDMVLIKAHVGEHETSLPTLRKCVAYFTEFKEKKPQDYFTTVFALSDAYIHHRKLDSASLFNKAGYSFSAILEDTYEWKSHFILNEGINQFYKENYQAAKDSLTKSIDLISDTDDPVSTANLSMGYFYLGKTLSALGEPLTALEAHKKVDEIYSKNHMAIPEIRNSYDVLIEHYKKSGDKDLHLKYIERRLAIDSSLNSDYKYLIKNVVQKYDTPKLLSEKQEIIDALKNEKKSFSYITIGLISISILFLAFWIQNYIKRKTYKKKFNELYNASTSGSNDKEKKKEPIADTQDTEIGIAEDIIADILNQLSQFEKNKGFLEPDITTNSLSKRFNTNYKYLSKVVNKYKSKSFSTYINDLRIDYSVARLKEDKKFKQYTMAAIAKEIGFNTSQAFSKSFYKKNGIHPSYFIKQLQKQDE
ncbi:AraC-type DNA-binding protein [Aquimarina spongiae]|uniref:AraC-type DNA-binding protein n=2 Tax=Aquimarina spongiae TaxID=570521 RepID=A0A1M6IWY1_9FLAO|nr:AraC-type DNA-binding protein [Aquimarina spongiae]